MTDDLESLGGVPVRSEQIGYSADEMIVCGKCTRPNPPNRLNCFYCGEALKLPEEVAASVQFRPTALEDWEPGINLVATGGFESFDPQTMAAALAFDHDLAATLKEVEPPVPLFRVPPEEADEVEARLSRAGLSIVRIEDGALSPAKPPTRLRGVTFRPSPVTFHPFNSDVSVPMNIADINLVVIGAIVTTTAESKLKKTRKETKEFDEHVSFSDYAVIDLYSAADENGFRILSHGFDFSCLGERKSLVASENVKVLIEKLRETFPDAVFDRTYTSKSAFLDQVWPRTVANTSKGIERNWFGVQRSTGTTTSNEEQFTRYSRMLRKLL